MTEKWLLHNFPLGAGHKNSIDIKKNSTNIWHSVRVHYNIYIVTAAVTSFTLLEPGRNRGEGAYYE